MNILFWSQHFWPLIGGIEVFAAEILPRLQARGHKLHVITSELGKPLPEHTVFQGIPVSRFDFTGALVGQEPAKIVNLIRQVAAVKTQFKPDIVHLNSITPDAFFHLRTATAISAPTVQTMHGTILESHEAALKMGRQLIAHCDHLTGVSQYVLNDALRHVPAAADKGTVILNGIVEPDVVPEPPRDGPPQFLFIGRLSPEKGCDIAIRAMPEILRVHPDARLVVAGDGPEKEPLERLAAETPAAAAIEFVGWVPPEEVYQHYLASTCVLMPSRWQEPFGLVATQAGFAARAVVGLIRGGLPEIVVDGETGRLVESEEPAEFAAAALDLLAEPGRAASWGAAARQRCETLFGIDRCVSEYEQQFEKVLA